MTTYRVFDVTGSNALAIEHGQRLYRAIHTHLIKGESVEVDFTGIEVLTTGFIGFAFGQLLTDIPKEKVDNLVSFVNINDTKRDRIKDVMSRAYKWYFYEQQNQA